MSAKRIPYLSFVPDAVRRAFISLDEPACSEEELFREVVARAVLDALGATGMNSCDTHDAVVQRARMWFKFGSNVEAYCDFAGINTADTIRAAVLAEPPAYMGNLRRNRR